MFPALKEAQGKLEAKQKDLYTLFDQAGPDLDFTKITAIDGDSLAKVKHVQALNKEIDTLAEEVEAFLAVEATATKARERRDADKPDDGTGEPGSDPAPKGKADKRSFGEMVTDSKVIKGMAGGVGPEVHFDVEVKTIFQTSFDGFGAGWIPQVTRTGKLVDFPTRPIQLIDLIPATTTAQAAVVYMEETTFSNNSAELLEGGVYSESALALTQRSSNVRKLGTFIPVTDEQLDDVPQVQGYLTNRLPFMLRQRLDSQILNGNGTAPNLRGFLNVAGIQTQAKGADPTPDAIYKAMVNIRLIGRAMPDAAVFHPLNWQTVQLLRTADGLYIWGSPSETTAPRIWGLPVVLADSIPSGTALVGDYGNYTELSTRRGIDVQISNSHGAFFIQGQQAIRADVRVALIPYRPLALCTVTGLL